MARKRSNGDGALRQRPNGIWELTIMDGFQDDGKRKYNLRPDLPCMERCVTASDLIMPMLKVAVQVECMVSRVRVVTVLLTHVASVPEFFNLLNVLGLLPVQFLNKSRIGFRAITASRCRYL